MSKQPNPDPPKGVRPEPPPGPPVGASPPPPPLPLVTMMSPGWREHAHEYVGYNLRSCLHCGHPEDHPLHSIWPKVEKPANGTPAYPRCATCKHWELFSPMLQGTQWGECQRLQNAPGDIVTLKFVTHEPHSPPCLIAQSDFGCVLHSEITG